MKKHFRYLTFFPLLLILLLGTALTSQPTAVKAEIDSVCLTLCQQMYFLCFSAAGGKNSEQNVCLAQYRHCIARCDK
jgi:hypothetical protein